MSDCPELEAARGLADLVAERAGEGDAARAIPHDVARRLAEAGLFRVCVPARYGGSERHVRDVVRVIEEIGRADGSAGWCVMIGATTGLLAGSLPEDWARKIYGSDPDVATCGVVRAGGVARPVAGGHSVRGSWPFASGISHSDWVVGGCNVVGADGETPAPGPHGPETRLFFFEPTQVRVLDTWRTSGLRGTGSHDFEVSDAFVPDGRSVVLGGRPLVDGPLFKFPTLGLLALGVTSVSLGIARRSIQEFIALAGGKVPTGSARTLANRPLAQRAVADAEASLRAARAFLFEVLDEVWAAAQQGALSTEARAQLRLAATHSTWRAAHAVDQVYQAAGGTSIYDVSPLSRCFRDVHVATQHLMVAEPTLELVGRVLLGVGAEKSLL